MITPTYTPRIGSWAWMCCALQDGMKIRKPEWPADNYIHVPDATTGVIRSGMGIPYELDVVINQWEVWEEPMKPLTLEPHSFLWAYAKAMAGNLHLRPVADPPYSGLTYSILYGVLVCAVDPGLPLNLSPLQLAGRWEVL